MPNSLLRKWLYSSKTFNDVWKISTVLIRSKPNSLINHPSIRSSAIYFNTCDKILASWTLLHIPSVKSKILVLIVIDSSYVVSIIEEFKGTGRTKMEVLEEWIILQNNYKTILPYGLNDRIRDKFKIIHVLMLLVNFHLCEEKIVVLIVGKTEIVLLWT